MKTRLPAKEPGRRRARSFFGSERLTTTRLIAFIVSAMDWVFGVNAADALWSGVVGMIYQLL